jgi:ABC-type sulfate/molybdate transport systems ATPase subunit
MVFQNYALYPHMSVYDNMAYGLRNRGMPKDQIEVRVAEAAKLLGIETFLKRKPRELSGGQRQRVAMGRAIVREPQAFLFDEPLSNLDAKRARAGAHRGSAACNNRLKATSIFVTRDQMSGPCDAGDTVVVLNKGRIEQVRGANRGLPPAASARIRRHLHRLAGHEPDAGPHRRPRHGGDLGRPHRLRSSAVRRCRRSAGGCRHPPRGLAVRNTG